MSCTESLTGTQAWGRSSHSGLAAKGFQKNDLLLARYAEKLGLLRNFLIAAALLSSARGPRTAAVASAGTCGPVLGPPVRPWVFRKPGRVTALGRPRPGCSPCGCSRLANECGPQAPGSKFFNGVCCAYSSPGFSLWAAGPPRRGSRPGPHPEPLPPSSRCSLPAHPEPPQRPPVSRRPLLSGASLRHEQT